MDCHWQLYGVTMAHFAELDDNNTVIRVLVVPDTDEHRGQQYLAVDLLLGGTWIQCSFNGRIRKQFPGAGFTYDAAADVFIAPQPYPSWTLNASYDWQPPTAMPIDGNRYYWDETALNWAVLF